MSDGTTPRRDPFVIFLVVACAALSVLVALLAMQNRSLKAQISASAAARLDPPNALKVGEVFGPLDLKPIEGGETMRLPAADGSRAALVFVFSSTCPACKEAFPIFDDLAAEAASRGLDVGGVRSDAGQDQAVHRFPVYALATPNAAFQEKLPFVPVAMVLEPSGKVKAVRFGVPTAAQLEELKAAF